MGKRGGRFNNEIQKVPTRRNNIPVQQNIDFEVMEKEQIPIQQDIDVNDMPMQMEEEMPLKNNNLEKRCPPGCVPEKTNEEKGIRGIINNIKNAPEDLNNQVKKSQDDVLNKIGNKSNEIKNNTLGAIGSFAGNISKNMNKKIAENQPKLALENGNNVEDITMGGGRRKRRTAKRKSKGKHRTAKGKGKRRTTKRKSKGKRRTAKGKGKRKTAKRKY